MSLLEHTAPTLAPVFQAAPTAATDTAVGASQYDTGHESVRGMELPADVAVSGYAPVGSFLAADPNVAEATAYGDGSPTVMVSVPLSRAVLEAACLNATGEQKPDDIAVTAEQISSWSDDQIRAWAIGEALDNGAGAAMNTVDDWQTSSEYRAGTPSSLNRPGVSGDSDPWEGLESGHVRKCVEEVPAGVAGAGGPDGRGDPR